MYRVLICSCFAIDAVDILHAQEPPAPIKSSPLAEALDDLFAGKRGLETVRLDVAWTEGSKLSSITVYGDGLSIHWQGKQFRLSAAQRLDLLRKVKAAKLITMPANLGELPKGAESMRRTTDNGRGSIALHIGEQAKVVEHDNRGPVNEEFVRLAKDLLAACIRESTAGSGITSLADGLQQVLENKLDARAMKIEVEYLRHLACHTHRIEGYATNIGGLSYWGNPFHGTKTLTVRELAAFITRLQEAQFQKLPELVNPQYDIFLTIRVRVLDQEHSVGGCGYHPKKSPEDQQRRFQDVWQASYALHPPHVADKQERP